MLTPTEAKDVAIYFIERAKQSKDSKTIARTTKQVKELQEKATFDTLISMIDYLIDIRKISLYSFGYIVVSYDSLLRSMPKQLVFAEDIKKQQEELLHSNRKELPIDHEQANRNKHKSESMGYRSRYGEKYSFNLFEE